MKLFGRAEVTAVEAATTVRDAAVTKRGRLAAQVEQARLELERLKSQAASAALREAPLEVEEISGDVAQTSATVDALSTALAAADGEVAKAEQQLASAQDAEQRAASIHELMGLVDQIEAAGLPFKAALRDLVGLLDRGGQISPDCKAVGGVFVQLDVDADHLLGTAIAALGHLAKEIELGSAPARLPRPAPTLTPVARSAPADTVSVCLLFDGRWVDPSTGLDRHCAKGWDVGLVPEVAARAIAARVAVRSDSAQAKKLRAERASPVPNPDALNLDDPTVAPPALPEPRTINPHLTQWQMPSAGAPRPWISKGAP